MIYLKAWRLKNLARFMPKQNAFAGKTPAVM
jgi:hypothetical protein